MDQKTIRQKYVDLNCLQSTYFDLEQSPSVHRTKKSILLHPNKGLCVDGDSFTYVSEIFFRKESGFLNSHSRRHFGLKCLFHEILIVVDVK